MKTIFSGIQPSGKLHVGNYIGSIQQWLDIQKSAQPDDRIIFMLADLHTITVPQQPGDVKKNTLDLASLYLASGIDPEKAVLFAQSHNSDHPYLGWMFDCITPMGWMERMTQYKDKSVKQGERTSVGLFHYPTLMAADIVLYDTDIVPVGEDQSQHIEYARDIVERFNRLHGEVFVLPQIVLQKHGARVMSLQNPQSKMSKSDKNENSRIGMLDTPDEIRAKVMKAVTDSGSEIKAGDDKPALTNLLSIYSVFSGNTVEDLVQQYDGKGYGAFKKDLAEIVVEKLRPIQEVYRKLEKDQAYVKNILAQGAEKACNISGPRLRKAREAVGFLL